MKLLKRIAVMALLVFAGLWIAVQIAARNPPQGLGAGPAGLAECPETPNCVCSDGEHGDKMPPLEFVDEPAKAKAAVKKALAKMGISVIAEEENYVHGVATTPIMRFKDDLEFLIEPQEKRIQFRSASRLGKSDLGKNRQRLGELFSLLKKDGIRAEGSK